MPGVLLLTGTCGSGKTTVSRLLGARPGWTRIAEDDLWPRLFGRERGAFGSEEHWRKRAAVHALVFSAVSAAIRAGRNAVIDATVHEAPPEAFREYRTFFDGLGVPWAIRVLHPRLEVAVARDAARAGWHAGAGRVADLRAKFTAEVFPLDWFVDTSGETPAQTVASLLGAVSAP
jgi:predicted kinase